MALPAASNLTLIGSATSLGLGILCINREEYEEIGVKRRKLYVRVKGDMEEKDDIHKGH